MNLPNWLTPVSVCNTAYANIHTLNMLHSIIILKSCITLRAAGMAADASFVGACTAFDNSGTASSVEDIAYMPNVLVPAFGDAASISKYGSQVSIASPSSCTAPFVFWWSCNICWCRSKVPHTLIQQCLGDSKFVKPNTSGKQLHPHWRHCDIKLLVKLTIFAWITS